MRPDKVLTKNDESTTALPERFGKALKAESDEAATGMDLFSAAWRLLSFGREGLPRMARVVLLHMPDHVVQREHNREVVFAGAEDHKRCLDDLQELSSTLGVRVYAYCLMPNYLNALLRAGAGRGGRGGGQVNEGPGGPATQYRNRLEGPSGSAVRRALQVQPGADGDGTAGLHTVDRT